MCSAPCPVVARPAFPLTRAGRVGGAWARLGAQQWLTARVKLAVLAPFILTMTWWLPAGTPGTCSVSEVPFCEVDARTLEPVPKTLTVTVALGLQVTVTVRAAVVPVVTVSLVEEFLRTVPVRVSVGQEVDDVVSAVVLVVVLVVVEPLDEVLVVDDVVVAGGTGHGARVQVHGNGRQADASFASG